MNIDEIRMNLNEDQLLSEEKNQLFMQWKPFPTQLTFFVMPLFLYLSL